MKTLKFLLKIWPFLALLAVVFLNGCGGGSGGTGFPGTGDERLLSGKVVSQTDVPLAGVSVTVEQTGDSTTTDSQGFFVLVAPSNNNDISLSIQSSTVDTSVNVTPVADASQVRVDVTLDTTSGTTSIEQIDAKALIVGACDIAFENGAIIRQSKGIISGTNCVAKVVVYGDGKLLSRIPVAVQNRKCDGTTDWTTASLGKTEGPPHRGVAQVAFPFFDTDEYCEYRIVAPFNDPNHAPVFFPIHTFRKQAFDAAQEDLGNTPRTGTAR